MDIRAVCDLQINVFQASQIVHVLSVFAAVSISDAAHFLVASQHDRCLYNEIQEDLLHEQIER